MKKPILSFIAVLFTCLLHAQTFEETKEKAMQGDADAQTQLGYMYWSGEGTQQDYAKAFYWYKKSARQGNRLGQFNLGTVYLNGQGTQQDYHKAFYWYKRSAEQGYVYGQAYLGIMYFNRQDKPNNKELAAYWLNKSYVNGHAKAKAFMDEHGLSTQESGTFTDPRDGRTYELVRIVNQVWMVENLNYDAGSGCWCYDNNSRNCDKYGLLYNWETAKRACPDGWHLPSKSEFEALLNRYGGEGEQAYTALKIGGKSGFSALFGGYRRYDDWFIHLGDDGFFWSSSLYQNVGAWILNIGSPSFDDAREEAWVSASTKSLGRSVRCVQD